MAKALQGIPYAIGEAKSFEELLGFYRNYAVFLNVSDHVSMALLEAMMTGMPVVIFPPQNHQYLFKDKKNCLIVGTEETAAQAIQYLFDNPDERKRLGFQARRTVLNYFDVKIFRNQWNKLLKKVVRDNLKR